MKKFLKEKTGMNIEVLNAGVRGYGTFQSLWKLERIASEVKPDLVIIGAFVSHHLVCDTDGNDLVNNFKQMEPSPEIQPAKLPFLTHHPISTILFREGSAQSKRYLTKNRFAGLIRKIRTCGGCGI